MQVRPQKSLSLYTSTGVCCVGKAAHIPAEETRRAAIAYGPGRLTRQHLQKERAVTFPAVWLWNMVSLEIFLWYM